MRKLALFSALALLSTACGGLGLADGIQGPWQLTSGTVDGEQIPILDSHPITITFEDDQVEGTAACNGYGGTYELSGSEISIGDLAMTEMACFPEETMTAERLYTDAMTRVDTVSVAEQLILRADDVELFFDPLEPAPTSELTNTVWVLDTVIDGDTATSAQGERATLELFTDGSVLGGTGCRLLTCHYEVQGAQVLFTELSAEGECPPELMTQDDHVVTVLGDGFRAEIEGGRLTLWSMGDLGLGYVADS